MKLINIVLDNIAKCFLFSFLTLFFYLNSVFAASGIKITSPKDNTVVHPGEEITTTVESVDGFDLETGLIFLPREKGFVVKPKVKRPVPDNPSFTTLPATYSFTIPLESIGSEYIEAYGRSVTGEEVVDTITLIVEQTGVLESLIVYPKAIIFHLDWNGNLDSTWNDYEYIGADAVFSDGVKRDIDEQGVVFSSTNPSVVSIDSEGKVVAHKQGEAKIIASYSGVTTEVPIIFQKPRGLPRSETIQPTTTIDIRPSANSSGWHNTDVTVILTAQDNEGGSGVHSIYYEFSNIGKLNQIKGDTAVITLTEEGKYNLYYHAQDKDTNHEKSSHETLFKIDKTEPVITISGPQDNVEYILNSSVTSSWSATDALSGLSSSTGTVESGQSLDTTIAGAKTFSVTAEDKAGNNAEKEVTYYVRYDFSGVLQPVNADGSSVFKLGKVIPVKFQLKDAQGNYISTATAKVYLSKISDNVAGTEVEAESPGEANTGNLFRYVAVDNQYIFNLGTSSLSQGTWQIRIELDDGSSKYVNIALK